MMRYHFGSVLTMMLALVAGNATAATNDGIWRSHGYGVILKIHGTHASVFDYTGAFCFKRPGPDAEIEDLFRDPKLSPDGKLLATVSIEALTKIAYDSLNDLPAACQKPSQDSKDPRYNFDVFSSYFNDYYAFFAQRAVDWNALRERYRSAVSPQTTDADLLKIFRAMLLRLQDRHTNVHTDSFYVNAATTDLFDQWQAEYFRDSALLNDPEDFHLEKTRIFLRPAWNHYLDAGSLRQLSSSVTIGTANSGRFGYISVLTEEGARGVKREPEGIATGIASLDTAFATMKGRSGLIVDVRINYGGDDEIALALAGLITDRDRAGFIKCTRDGAGFTPAQETRVRRRPNAFDGPVVVLSSPHNVSSGENFVIMAKSFPNVVLVGDRTASVHSDVLQKQLPNGWKIGISNEAFVAPDGSMYETVGVAPDVLVPYYPEAVKESGVDPLLEKAMDLLGSSHFAALVAAVKRGPMGRASPCPQQR
jgi:carboxyl-terminal processing protease